MDFVKRWALPISMVTGGEIRTVKPLELKDMIGKELNV